MTNNLNLSQVTASQNNKEVTINDQAGEIDAALTDSLAVAVTSSNAVSLTNDQFRRYHYFVIDEDGGDPANGSITITVPGIARGEFFMINDTAFSVTVEVSGQSEPSPSLEAGERSTLTCDGSDVFVAGGGGGGAVAVQEDGTEITAEASTFNFVNWPGSVVDDGAGSVDIDFAGAGFSIEQLPNVHAWYDFSDEGSISVTGNLIDQINDKSGNGNHATGSGAGRPDSGTTSINSLNVGDFASAEFLQVPWVGASALDLTVVVVLQTTEAGSGTNWYESPMILGDEIAGSVNDFGYVMNSGALSFVVSEGGQHNSIGTYNDGNPHLGIADRAKATGAGTHYVDGSADGAYTTSAVTVNAVGGTIGLGGDEDGNANRQWAGQIAEVVILYGLLTTTQRQQLEGHLAHKWGFEANLPADHPYKVAPPPNAQTVPEVVGSVEGTFSSSQVLLRYVANKPVSFPANLNGSAVELGVATTGTPTFTVEKNGSQVGDFSFGAAATTPTFGSNPAFSLASGDVLTVTAPASADASAADIAINLAAFGGNATSVSSFLELPDTPITYTGQAGKAPIVNASESGLFFEDVGNRGGGELRLISIETASAQAELDIPFPGGYSKYVLVGYALPVNSGVNLQSKVTTDNFSSVEEGGTDYAWVDNRVALTTSYAAGGSGDNADTLMQISINDGVDAGDQLMMTLDILLPHESGVHTTMHIQASKINPTNTVLHHYGMGRYLGTTPVDGLRLFFSSGNIASAKFYVYGLLDSVESRYLPLSTFLNATPSTADDVFVHVATQAFTLADEFAGSEAYALNGPNGGAVVFDVERNGSKIGEISFADSSGAAQTATFTTTGGSEESFAIGDRLHIVSPANLQSMSKIAFNLIGTLV